MSWVTHARTALLKSNHIHFPLEGYTLTAKWMADLSDVEKDGLKELLSDAYESSSLWESFAGNFDTAQDVLVFYVTDAEGKMVATRSIGAFGWTATHWDEEVAALVGQKSPVVGAYFTVSRGARGNGVGKELYNVSSLWMKDVAKLQAFFGFSLSVLAVGMYARKGAMFRTDLVNGLLRKYECASMSDFSKKCSDIERLEMVDKQMYVWVFDDALVHPLTQYGYGYLKDFTHDMV